MIAERAGIGMDEAFACLRGHARRRGRLLGEVAHDVVERRMRAAELLG